MRNVFNKIKNSSIGNIINFVCFVASIGLGIASFIVPPTGVIDSSVLMFIAEIGVFSTLSRIPDFIKSVTENHTNLEISKGDTSIKIGEEEN